MGFCCISWFGDSTLRQCYSGFTQPLCENFPLGTGVYYNTLTECRNGCGLGSPQNPTCTFGPRSQCSNGTFSPGVPCTASTCVPEGGATPESGGICCKNGTCITTATNKAGCDAVCGHWLSTIDVQAIGFNLNTTYQFGSDPNDCQFCSYARPVLTISDIGSCDPAIGIHPYTMTTDEICVNTDPILIPTASSIKTDLLFNNFNLPTVYTSLDGVVKSARNILVELLSCPLSPNTESSYSYMANQILNQWYNNNINLFSNCTSSCCTCPGGFGSIPVCDTPYGGSTNLTFDQLCNKEYCPAGSFPGDTTVPCGGPNQGAGGPGGGGSSSCFTSLGYCNELPGAQCGNCVPTSYTNETVRNVILVINNVEVCVPVACGDCIGYQFCGGAS